MRERNGKETRRETRRRMGENASSEKWKGCNNNRVVKVTTEMVWLRRDLRL